MQKRFLLNGIAVRQPDSGLSYNFESTYSEDTGRDMSGIMHSTPLFTVESYGYSATGLTKAEMRQILQIIGKGQNIRLTRYSPFYGEWREDPFYVGKGSLAIGRLCEDDELFESLTFNLVGVNPI